MCVFLVCTFVPCFVFVCVSILQPVELWTYHETAKMFQFLFSRLLWNPSLTVTSLPFRHGRDAAFGLLTKAVDRSKNPRWKQKTVLYPRPTTDSLEASGRQKSSSNSIRQQFQFSDTVSALMVIFLWWTYRIYIFFFSRLTWQTFRLLLSSFVFALSWPDFFF